MKKIFITIALISSILYGHGGHTHKSKSSIQQIAKKTVKLLIEKNSIDKSWERPHILNTTKKRFGKNIEWVVSFENSKIEDKTKQKFYVFVSEDGKVTGANFTGE